METNILPETSDEPNKGNKKLWSFINHRKTNSVGVTPLKYKGTLWDKPKDKAEILNEQFKSVFPDPTHDEPEPPVTETDRPYPDIDELRITSDGVQKLLENLHPNKSMGPDQIYPRVLKQPQLVPRYLQSSLTNPYTLVRCPKTRGRQMLLLSLRKVNVTMQKIIVPFHILVLH